MILQIRVDLLRENRVFLFLNNLDVLDLAVVESHGNRHVAVLAHTGPFGRHRSRRGCSGKDRADDAGDQLNFHISLLIE